MWWSFRSPELSDLKQSSDVFVATQTIMNSQQEGCEKRLWLRLNISPWRNKNVRLFPLPSMLWLLLAVISRWGRDLQIGYPILTVGKCWSSILNLPFYGYYIYIYIYVYVYIILVGGFNPSENISQREGLSHILCVFFGNHQPVNYDKWGMVIHSIVEILLFVYLSMIMYVYIYVVYIYM